MMKKYKGLRNKKDIYISFIYLLLACAILASFSQLTSLAYRYGNFNFGELIIIMFNDSYTGYFTFPFLLGFILIIESPVEQNIMFTLTRYPSRKLYYKEKHLKIMRSVLSYIAIICLFCIIIGIYNSNFSNNISMATRSFANIYLFEDIETDNLIFEIVKIIILQSLLFYFFSLVHTLLTQFKISQSMVFIIYTGIQIIMAGISLGFMGERIKPFSLFSISSSVYGYGLMFIHRLLILITIDFLLLIINFKIFEHKDIVLAKGSKQYQNE